MLDDAFAYGQGQIYASESSIAQFKMLDDAQGMQVVIEAQAVGAKRVIECALPRVAEGRMADVMHERKRFGEIFVEAKCSRYCARDLRHFHGVCEAATEVI